MPDNNRFIYKIYNDTAITYECISGILFIIISIKKDESKKKYF